MAPLPREAGRASPSLPGWLFHSSLCKALSLELGLDPGRLGMLPPRHSSSSSQPAKRLLLQRAADLLPARGSSVHKSLEKRGMFVARVCLGGQDPFQEKRRNLYSPALLEAEALSPSSPGQPWHSAGTTSNLQKNPCYPGLHLICVTSCPDLRCCFTPQSGWSFAQRFTPHQVAD